MPKTCCFIGHRDVSESIRPALAAAIERHITEYGVTDFLVGNYGAFDRMSASEVRAAKARHPEVRLYLMLPYLPESGRSLPDMEGFDGAVYPEGMETVPYRVAIPRLNRRMVDEADFAIAYVAYGWGGAAATLEYAKRRERRGEMRITNLAEETQAIVNSPSAKPTRGG